MGINERIGAPDDKGKRRAYCAGFVAGVMEARGYILQVRSMEFKHTALDALDKMLCEVMDSVIEGNDEMRKPNEDRI